VAGRLLTLEQFGYYGLAVTLGRSVYLLIAPVFSAVFPRLSGCVARQDMQALAHLYSLATQMMAVAILPAAAVMAWMGYDAALLWLGSAATASAVALPVAWLVAGSALNGVMNVPYAVQLACGNTRAGVRINLLLLCIAVPAAVALTVQFGVAGLAGTWVLINAVNFLISVPMTHRMAPLGPVSRWLRVDLAPAAAASLCGASLAAWLLGPAASRLQAGGHLLAALAAAYAAALLAAPRLRREFLALVGRQRAP
jgi:O-antigen/teichoic acid export membrane protein